MRHSLALCLSASLCFAAACGGGSDEPENENEVITTVTLTFTPSAGGTAIVAAFDDPDGDGGEAPTIDPINLAAAATYDMTVKFENQLEDPAEDITLEVMDESDQHQLFFYGTAVDGPASTQPGAPLTHAYADQDVNGLPIGLDNTITANAAGTGVMTVVLRHMPPVNDEPVKVDGVAAQVASGGIESIGGSTDAKVDFNVTVQ